MAHLNANEEHMVIVDCDSCGDPLNLSEGEHTYRHPTKGKMVCFDCKFVEER